LVGPAGTAVSSLPFIASDAGGFPLNPLNLFARGDYTLTVERTGDTTGPYQFALRDLRGAVPLTPGAPVSGVLSPANETDLYRFTAAAGDRYLFHMQANSGAPTATWRLIDPYGNALFTGGLSDFLVTLSRPGSYSFLFEV